MDVIKDGEFRASSPEEFQKYVLSKASSPGLRQELDLTLGGYYEFVLRDSNALRNLLGLPESSARDTLQSRLKPRPRTNGGVTERDRKRDICTETMTSKRSTRA